MSNEMPKEIRFTNGSMDGEVWDTAEKGCPPDTVDAGGESYTLDRHAMGGGWALIYIPGS